MGTDIKALRTRIKSVQSTMHLTKAMGLVASSKIRRANGAMQKAKSFENSLTEIVNNIVSCPECQKNGYLKETDGKTIIIVIAGDRGLAGGYNANVFRLLREYSDAEIIPIGKRACDKYSAEFISSENYSKEDADALAKKLCREFLSGEFGKLAIVGTEYVSMMKQDPYIKYILPLKVPTDSDNRSILFEPSAETILNSVIPEYVAGCIMSAIRESFACEVAARRMAMDNAQKNATAMIDDLTLQYNRARQGSITQEITEIVAGSDA